MDKLMEREMLKRANTFLNAVNKPNKRIGANKRRGIREGYVPAPTPKSVQRFEQLNREDRWSKVKYGGSIPGNHGQGRISITVKDPADLFDVILPSIVME